MSGSNIRINITANDRASSAIDRVNKQIASMRAPVDRTAKSIAKFSEVSGLDALGKGFRGVAQESMQAFENVSRMAGPLGAVTSAASIAGMAALANEWAHLNSELGFAATRAGLTSGQLGALQGAAQLAGSSAGALTSGMTTLNDNLFNAAAGRAPEAVRAFNFLGIAFADAAGHSRSATQVLPELADKIAAIKDPTMQAQLATMLFGGAAENLLPFLRLGHEGIAKLVEISNKYNPVTQDMTDAANRLRFAETELGLSVTGLGNRIMSDLEPAITPLLHDMAELIHDHPKIAEGFIATGATITTFIGVLAALRFALWAVAGARAAAFGGVGAAVATEAAEAATGVAAAGGTGLLGTVGAPLALGAAGLAAGALAGHMQVPMVDDYGRVIGNWGGRDESTNPARAGVPMLTPSGTGLAATPFGSLISRGEGDYNSVNRGAAGGYRSGNEDLVHKTVAQVMADQASGVYNAAGRYQIVRDTMKSAVTSMNLKGDELFDQQMQDKIFEKYLAGSKRPQIADYLSGRSNDIHGAAKAVSEEWASVADPDTGQSHYAGVGNNRASIGVGEMEHALEASRKQIAAQGPVSGGINGGVGSTTPSAETVLKGGADIKIRLENFPGATETSADATGNMWNSPPRVEHAMPMSQ